MARSLWASSALCFVEQQHRRVLEHGACDGQALLLAAGQAHAFLAEVGRITLWQCREEVVRFRIARRGGDVFFACIEATVADVLGGVRAEQHGILRHQRDLGAQGLRIESAQVDAVEAHAAGVGIVEAHQQLQHRALAGAGGADQRDGFARPHVQREIRERGGLGPRGIAEFDVFEADFARGARRQRERRGGRRDVRALASSSAMRPMPPAARCSSAHTSVSAATEPVPIIA